jgi:hypothetical protein
VWLTGPLWLRTARFAAKGTVRLAAAVPVVDMGLTVEIVIAPIQVKNHD